MRLLTIIVLAISIGCGPECLKSHSERVWVEQQTVFTGFLHIGDIMIPQYQTTLAHWETITICDQYEVEKNGSN